MYLIVNDTILVVSTEVSIGKLKIDGIWPSVNCFNQYSISMMNKQN